MSYSPDKLTYSLTCVTDDKGVSNVSMSYSDSYGVDHKATASSQNFDNAIRSATKNLLSGVVKKYNDIEAKRAKEEDEKNAPNDMETLLSNYNDLQMKYDKLLQEYNNMKKHLQMKYDKLLQEYNNMKKPPVECKDETPTPKPKPKPVIDDWYDAFMSRWF